MTDPEGEPEVDVEELRAAAGWSPEARVVALASLPPFAFALVDEAGDEAVVDGQLFRSTDGSWSLHSSGLGRRGHAVHGLEYVHYACGRAVDGSWWATLRFGGIEVPAYTPGL